MMVPKSIGNQATGGLFPKGNQKHSVVKLNDQEEAIKVFQDAEINVTTEGLEALRSAIDSTRF